MAVMAWLFVASGGWRDPAAVVFFALWQLHYVHRAFVGPLLMPAAASPMPLSVPAMGFAFNVVNGLLQGTWLFRASPPYGAAWLVGPAFIGGTVLFLGGMAVNRWADGALARLRKTGYRLPRGGLFERISCPNYLGEIVEWTGWAVLPWSLPGAAFALWTAANLVPRALAHHRWYRERFPDMPPDRRAIVPYLL